ncbi:MAG: ATP-dependent Clp protease ATP-binding subunit ClpC, partial [Terriglobales bacterium]
VTLSLPIEAKRWILEKTCGDRSYGARPLRRALQRYVEDPLSELVIQGQLPTPAFVEAYLEADGLGFRPVTAPQEAEETVSS